MIRTASVGDWGVSVLAWLHRGAAAGALIVLGGLLAASAQAAEPEGDGSDLAAPQAEAQAEAERREWWRSVSGQDPDLVMPEEERRAVLQEVQDLLDRGAAQGTKTHQLATAIEDSETAARYAVALAGLRLNSEQARFLESLLTGRTVRAFLEMEARKAVPPLRRALAKLPPDAWKMLQTSWPELSASERQAVLRRLVSQLALGLGVKNVTLRPYVAYRARGMERSPTFVLTHIDDGARRPLVGETAQGTGNIFLGPASLTDGTAAEVLTLAVLEEVLHLSQRQARAELNSGRVPADKEERIRLMLLSANAAEYYPAAAVRGAYDPAQFQRHLLQPIEFEAKVVQYVLSSHERFLRRGTMHTLNGHDLFE